VVDSATRSAAWSGPEPTNSLDLAETVGSLAKQGYVFSTSESTDAPAAAFALEAQGAARSSGSAITTSTDLRATTAARSTRSRRISSAKRFVRATQQPRTRTRAIRRWLPPTPRRRARGRSGRP
jgi:hypothetical protein